MHPVKLQKAINGLLFGHPFFASMLLRQKIVEDNDGKTFSVDGESLRYNREFCDSLTHDEIMGVLAHEVMHLASFHHARAGGRDQAKWNKACDYAINPILIQSGFRLPNGALVNPAYSGKSAEEIYRALPDEQDKQDGNGNAGQGSKPSFGEVKPAQGKPASLAEEKAEIQVKQSVNQAKAMGKLPAFLDRALSVIPPRCDWREILARFVAEQVNTDLNWSCPSRRLIGSGLILPALKSQTIGNVIFACDTSGSISANDVSKFASELLNALQAFEDCGKTAELTAIYCDSRIQGIETLTPFDKPSPKGGGGTDFRPPFEHIEQNGLSPVAVVYMTDGYCNSFPSEPSYPVLWAVIGNYRDFKPPFGEVLLMDIEV